MTLEKGCGHPGKKQMWKKNKFTRIGKYITDILAFLIKSSHMAGLIYNELYVS